MPSTVYDHLNLNPPPSHLQVPVRHYRGYGQASISDASQHTVGEAADIYIPKTAYSDCDYNKAQVDKELAERLFSWLHANTDFDQLIMETSNGRDFWIHVSCRKNAKKNRHQVLRLTKK